ncbi:MAG: hypothetical protein Q8938_16385 [Bacteroidota bacterium]|nr:hypothetical protein [Bacteroidota bacterium]
MTLSLCGEVVPALAAGMEVRADTAGPTVTKKLAKLLYVMVDSSQTYMIPYIERKLKNLRHPDSDVKLYDSVVSLNILMNDAGIKATLLDDLNEAYAGNVQTERSKNRASTKTTYSKFLRNYDDMLAIKVEALQDLIEFQFTLYQILPKTLDLRYKNSSSIFIDPRSSRYQAEVNRGLDQAFESANKQPQVNLVSNIKNIDGTYFLTREDTLLLQPIVDDESVEDDRIYFWTQDSLEKPRVPLLPSKKDQSLHNLPQGHYHLYFKVSNGISYSRADSVVLDVYPRPMLSIWRPHDESLFRKFADRLVIQEYVFANRQIDYFSDYVAAVDRRAFVGAPPELLVSVADKKGAIYASRSFPLPSPDQDTAEIRGADLIPDIENTVTPVGAVRANDYLISFVARNPAMASKEVKNELNVYQRRPLSLLYDVMIFPVDQNGLYHSWINAGAGLDLRLNRWLSAIAIVGTDLAQASFRHFYTDLVANFGPIRGFASPFNKLEGGPALLINHDNGEQSTGFKLSYTFYSGTRTNLKVGASFYNQDHVNYYALRLTGDIFLNH